MSMQKYRLILGILLAGISLAASDSNERGIVPEDVIDARPPAAPAGKAKTKLEKSRPKYQPLDPKAGPQEPQELRVAVDLVRMLEDLQVADQVREDEEDQDDPRHCHEDFASDRGAEKVAGKRHSPRWEGVKTNSSTLQDPLV